MKDTATVWKYKLELEPEDLGRIEIDFYGPGGRPSRAARVDGPDEEVRSGDEVVPVPSCADASDGGGR